MSKGTQVRTLRIPQELWDEMVRECEKQNETRREAPFTMTGWMIHAMRSHIDHLKRGRRPRTPKTD